MPVKRSQTTSSDNSSAESQITPNTPDSKSGVEHANLDPLEEGHGQDIDTMSDIVDGLGSMGFTRGESGRFSIEGGAILNSPYNSPRSRSVQEARSIQNERDITRDTPAGKRPASHATPVAVKSESAISVQPALVDTAPVTMTSPEPVLVLKLRKPTQIATLMPLSAPEAVPIVSIEPRKSGGCDSLHQVLIICSNRSGGIDCGDDDDHNTGIHQENARRTELLVGSDGCLRRAALCKSISWAPPASHFPAPIIDLLRVHEYGYLRHLQDKCHRVDTPFGIPHSISLRDTVRMSPHEFLDADTPLGPTSLSAARRFCGAAMYAVDCAFGRYAAPGVVETASKCDRIFVLGRPPGHHAGPNGCVAPPTFWKRPEMTSSGFCLLNTAAVAAAYARHKYGREALHCEAFGAGVTAEGPNTWRVQKPRIAIIDIDIHHGNGTEACVRNLSPSMQPVPLPSSWAPVYQQSYKPWLDEDDHKETFFGSMHLFQGEHFYPGSGLDCCERVDPITGFGANVCNVTLTPVGPGPCDISGRAKLSAAQRAAVCDVASKEMRSKLEATMFPALAAFKPTLVIISSGFDAHYDDMYHYLTEQDYHWITDRLCEIASAGSGGRGCVISILEGGYSLSAPVPVPPAAGPALRNSKTKKAEEATSAPVPQKVRGSDPATKFAQLPGDGGLVKSVLAHVAALAGKEHWDSD